MENVKNSDLMFTNPDGKKNKKIVKQNCGFGELYLAYFKTNSRKGLAI